MKKKLSVLLIIVTMFTSGCGMTAKAPQNIENTQSNYYEDEKKEEMYIGNKNTYKFHKPSCNFLPDPKNQVSLPSRDDAIKKGYEPCAKCKP